MLTEEAKRILDERLKGLRKWWYNKENPNKLRFCSFDNCINPVDATTHMGIDTSCPYHRLLFNHWLYVVINSAPEILEVKETRQRMFREWVAKVGQDECDRIVSKMAIEPINWVC